MREALSFLTPIGGARQPTPAALEWFPLVGAGIGGAVGAVWWIAEKAWPVAVAAAIAVVADLALTGLLHVDGLADSADGLLPHGSRDRRLAVMAEPGVGAYGAAAVAATLLLRWAALASMRPSVLLLAALWCTARSAMAVEVAVGRYVGGGLATAFGASSAELGATRDAFRLALPPACLGALGALGLAALGRGLGGAVAVVAAALAAAAVIAFARRRIGGFTGDVLGAAGVVAETVGLVVAAAKW